MKRPVHTPTIMQMEALECGAASLAMILAYYGKWLPLEVVRADCGVSRDGAKATNLLKAARNYGLQAQGFSYTPEQLFTQASFPCIIHWNFNHFVVLNGFTAKHAVINDPARGITRIPLEEFVSSFTGICLEFAPGEAFEKGGKPKSVVDFARQRLRGTGSMFAFVLLITLVSSVLGILMPGFSRVFMDVLLTGNSPEWLYPFILLLSGVMVVSVVAELLRSIYMRKIEGKLAIVGASTFMWHVLRLPMEFFSQRMSGDIAGRQASNERVASAMLQQLAPLVLDVIMLVVYLIVMLRYSVMLTAIGLFSVFINIFAAMLVSQKRVSIARVRLREQGKMRGQAVAGIEMIETLKAAGAENGFFEKWAGYQAAVNTADVKTAYMSRYLGEIPSLVAQLCNVAVLIAGIYLCMAGEFTIGMLLAFQAFTMQFTAPARSIIHTAQTFTEMKSETERIDDVMNYKPDVEGDFEDVEHSEYDKIYGNIEIKNITFGYSKLSPPLIRDFSISIKPGQRIALVGGSGCGKSTLAKLISGLYQPWSGEITYDGKPKSEISRSAFTSSIAVVDQDIILFNDTIAANIKMWDGSIADYEMRFAAGDAQIHKDILQREGGYHYKMAEGGRDFSGGQRQRLEIARALAADPTIIIMDEATSALDAKTENEVVRAINQRGITCIIIAHRLSTIRDCDEILVMEQGLVVERGTHEALYKLGGLYSALVTSE